MLAVSAPALSGCMHTRYAESNHYWNLGGNGHGGCSCGSDHHTMQKERRWDGFWFGQPDQVRP
jgi:hypothetical protein